MSKIAVLAVLLICFVCAASEALDRWDNSFQTGNESESSVLLLALSLGTAFLLVRHTYGSAVRSFTARVGLRHPAKTSRRCFPNLSIVNAVCCDPPGNTLRI